MLDERDVDIFEELPTLHCLYIGGYVVPFPLEETRIHNLLDTTVGHSFMACYWISGSYRSHEPIHVMTVKAARKKGL